jgi:4-aminobutyrate aminotransferase-like enzyme
LEGRSSFHQGYLAEVYRQVRAAGGLCVADEVQTGYGRIGTDFWAFEAHGSRADMWSMGKPIGNGHPIGAVVTTPEVAASFNNGMEFFSTFGGNPVSCAIGLAVLECWRRRGCRSTHGRLASGCWPDCVRWSIDRRWLAMCGARGSSLESSWFATAIDADAGS